MHVHVGGRSPGPEINWLVLLMVLVAPAEEHRHTPLEYVQLRPLLLHRAAAFLAERPAPAALTTTRVWESAAGRAGGAFIILRNIHDLVAATCMYTFLFLIPSAPASPVCRHRPDTW